MEIRVLASGSGGNSILISSKETRILVDAGLTCKELSRRLMQAGCTFDDVSAVVVTHEHQDHVRGVGVISRKHGLPIFMNEGTLAGASSLIGEAPSVRMFSTGDAIEVGDMTVQTYPVPHDAAEPVGLTVRNGYGRVGIALDMGYPTGLTRERLRGSNALILEFNHDPEMLRHCNRPWDIQQPHVQRGRTRFSVRTCPRRIACRCACARQPGGQLRHDPQRNGYRAPQAYRPG
jgi:phosphoribosyl 1,2-cyclic phosphodiesterase